MQGIKSKIKSVVPLSLYNKAALVKHKAKARYAAQKFGFPAGDMVVYAVTGTNGKTTTSLMLAKVLDAAGHKVALLSSAVVKIDGGFQDSQLELTTADTWRVNELISRARDSGATHLVIEVSSHALSQDRIFGVPVATAIWTNLTQDHLDYHGTMQGYANAKRKLMLMANDRAVFNLDDDYYAQMVCGVKASKVTYGVDGNSTWRIKEVKSELGSVAATITPPGGDRIDLHLQVTGKFQAHNVASVFAALEGKVDREITKNALEDITEIPGRMVVMQAKSGATIVVDHAHTEDALRGLYDDLQPLLKGKMIVVNGCDGDRDPGKRFPIGRLTAERADFQIVTDLEPYTEDPAAIRAEVIKGIIDGGGQDKFAEIADRLEAIRAALKRAKKDDIVIIPGLGNQAYRATSKGKVPWNEVKIVREMLDSAKG